MNSDQLRKNIIKPTLDYLGLWSRDAEDLLSGTAAQESRMGEFVQQINGPAVGIYQMEPATHRDIWDNYLAYRQSLASTILQISGSWPPDADQMVGNLFYATAMARVHYLRVPEAIPGTLPGQADYWKQYYNTDRGAGTIDQYVSNYQHYA